jgi:Multiubiquitin
MEENKRKTGFTIFVNNKPFETDEHQLTGAQVKKLAGIPPDYELFQVRGDQTAPIGNEEVIHIHENLHFRAIPAGTFGENATTA